MVEERPGGSVREMDIRNQDIASGADETYFRRHVLYLTQQVKALGFERAMKVFLTRSGQMETMDTKSLWEMAFRLPVVNLWTSMKLTVACCKLEQGSPKESRTGSLPKAAILSLISPFLHVRFLVVTKFGGFLTNALEVHILKKRHPRHVLVSRKGYIQGRKDGLKYPALWQHPVFDLFNKERNNELN